MKCQAPCILGRLRVTSESSISKGSLFATHAVFETWSARGALQSVDNVLPIVFGLLKAVGVTGFDEVCKSPQMEH